ncbi:MAG: phosphatase PAP2 family protein [Chloroflexi bacterium]|nr:phosphatase PAP2 family protein [Chloroflexota bacterium]
MSSSPAPLAALVAIASVGLLVALGGLIRAGALDSVDRSVLGWIANVEFSGLGATTEVFDALLDGPGAAAIVIGAVVALFALKRSGYAMALLIGMGVLGIAYVPSDWALGHFADRVRPIPGSGDLSFASGHVLFATIAVGFAGWLAVRRQPMSLRSLGIIAVAVLFVTVAGFTRVYSQAHHPSDVMGGILWGFAGLGVLTLVYRRLENVRWISAPKMGRDVPGVSGDGIRYNGSYASAVVLDANAGTATKHFRPPAIIQAMYWTAFQSRFPYDHNRDALEATTYRRRIAGLLTRYRFGKDLVAPVLEIDWSSGKPSMITELIPGHEAENDEPAKEFLGDVSELFANAGLPVWQLNPRNPHAHTNLILTPEGDYKIVDLESAIVTPFPAAGQFRSALRRGAYPIFDDIDFDRLRAFVASNRVEMHSALGTEGMRELDRSIADAERSITAWQGSETRLASKIIRVTYAMFNWTGAYRKLRNLVETSDERAEAFLVKGLDRWQDEGRISASDANETRRYLAGGEVHDGLRHLGAHLAITAVLRFPFGSIARPVWTLFFFLRELSLRLRPGTRDRRGSLMLHGPHVMLLSIVPGFGGLAYLVSGPLRKPILLRLILDRVARKLRLGSRFAPRPFDAFGDAFDDPASDAGNPLQATKLHEEFPVAVWASVDAARPVRRTALPVPEPAAARATSRGGLLVPLRDVGELILGRCMRQIGQASAAVGRAGRAADQAVRHALLNPAHDLAIPRLRPGRILPTPQVPQQIGEVGQTLCIGRCAEPLSLARSIAPQSEQRTLRSPRLKRGARCVNRVARTNLRKFCRSFPKRPHAHYHFKPANPGTIYRMTVLISLGGSKLATRLVVTSMVSGLDYRRWDIAYAFNISRRANTTVVALFGSGR